MSFRILFVKLGKKTKKELFLGQITFNRTEKYLNSLHEVFVSKAQPNRSKLAHRSPHLRRYRGNCELHL